MSKTSKIMSSRIKSDVKNLFEFWCEVKRSPGVDRNSRNGAAAAAAGVIVERFPERFREEKTIAMAISMAFPCDFSCDSVQSYSFVLTTDNSDWRFCFCRHDPKTDTAMIIITYLPWHDTFLRLTTVLAELRRSDNPKEFSNFLTEAYSRGVPDPGGCLRLLYNEGQSTFVFERPLHFQLPSIPENHNLNLYYNFVDPRNMIAVFAAMLAERRIIFTSRRLDRLSSCIQAATAFLYPMVWQHIFIPVLPMELKDYISAPMPYLIGVPEMVLETMSSEELGDVVILNCDTKIFETPFDDVHDMPAEIVSQLKKKLSHSHEHIGDRVSKIFLCVLVQLIGGYRDAVEFHGGAGKSFNRDKFIETRPSHLRPFLTKMMELQIFQQFIEERIDMLNTGLGTSDEFELETVRYAEVMKKRGRNYVFLKHVKDKTNPAVKSAVKSVKEGSRGVKTAYKDLKSKFRDSTPPNSNNNNNNNRHFRSHLSSTNSQHDRIDGYVVGSGKTAAGHHSAPSSPIFNKRHHHLVQHNPTAGGFQYASPAEINGVSHGIRKAAPLAMSSSSSHIQQTNGYAHFAPAAAHHPALLAASPTVSPSSSICSSEMNLSQELQNHPLFKSPIVDRSLKPSSSLEFTQRQTSVAGAAARSGGPPPARPPPPVTHSLQSTPLHSTPPTAATLPPSYYNHPFVTAQTSPQSQNSNVTPSHFPSLPTQQQHAHVEVKTPSAALQKPPTPPFASNSLTAAAPPNHTSTPNNKSIITTDSIFDTPPDMQSPPVPPRRIAAGANQNLVVAAGIDRLQRNCWNTSDDKKQQHSSLLLHDELRNSSSSNTSTGSTSSSSASFVSAASTFSVRPVPVPAPRLKKESLRSLQPQPTHLQVPHPSGSLHSAASSSYASQEETLNNDLISLDDSNNTSFDLEDFDPLNQNARPLPSKLSGGVILSNNQKSTTLPMGNSSSISNPLYTYYTPQHRAPPLQPPSTKPPPPPTDIPSYDDDFELLRKYGLDQFTLTSSVSATASPSGKMLRNSTATSGAVSGTPNRLQPTASSASMQNWTTFD